MPAQRTKAPLNTRGSVSKQTKLKRHTAKEKCRAIQKYTLKRPAAQKEITGSDSPKDDRFPSSVEESCALGLVKDWGDEEHAGSLSVSLPAVHKVKNEGGGRAVSIGLVKQGRLTLPGELLAYIVAQGGTLMRGEHCPGNADNSRYRERLWATDVVRKGSKRGELLLNASSFRPWMLGLPSSFDGLDRDGRKRILMTKNKHFRTGELVDEMQQKVIQLRKGEICEQSKIPFMVLTLSIHKDDKPEMFQCRLTNLSGAEVVQMQAPLGRYPLGELRTAVSRKIGQPPHRLELLPAAAITGDNPLARENDAMPVAKLLHASWK